MWPRRVALFINERIKHMNALMTVRDLELPDPADLLPSNWRELPQEYKNALYCEAWATLGANIAQQAWEARQPNWVQDPLPLLEFQPVYVAASGWCAPDRTHYAWFEGPVNDD